jgi:hypothetical protein
MNNYSNPVTVTGNPASFEASGDGKLLSLSVHFSPIQDLHGYANPWPGGGGKNLFDADAGSNGYINNSGAIVSRNYQLASDFIAVTAGNAYTISAASTMANIGIAYFDSNKAIILPRADNASRQTLTITPATGVAYVRFWLNKDSYTDLNPTNVKETYKVQFEAGSSATSYAPYSNICPISGRTGLSVYVSPTQDQQDATTYAVDWTSEAGTVYGGTLDVVTGVLTVDRAVCTESDFTTISSGMSAGGLHWADFNTTNITTNGTSLCSILGIRADGGPGWASAVPCYALTEGVRVRVYCEEGTLADFRSKYAGLQVCYPLATPLTYQLTPTQIALILGQNNVWSDSNEAVTLTYVIELFTRYTFIVNGNDYTGLVERDSYRTAVTPVYGETIQTLDGVGHTALLRVKGSLTVKLNPQTASQTAAICADLLNAPCEVQYKCLQRNVNVTALMVLDVVSAMFLSRCLYLGQKWNDVDEIVLKEL